MTWAKVYRSAWLGLAFFILIAPRAFSHCEIPCGIYDDQARIDMLEEDITTIEKSMKEIATLSAQAPVNYNQIVRWVENKEQHADDVRHIATQYFMAQRLKPAESSEGEAYRKYITQLTLLHQMVVYAMKAKQTTDLANVEKLRALVDDFKTAYLGSEKKDNGRAIILDLG